MTKQIYIPSGIDTYDFLCDKSVLKSIGKSGINWGGKYWDEKEWIRWMKLDDEDYDDW